MLTKNAFIFPGQGSQYQGMLKKIEKFEITKRYLGIFKDILGYSFENMTDEELLPTSVTQPSLYTVSAIYFEILKEKGIIPFIVAGHSLGEFSALYASEFLSFNDGLKIVSFRGKIMEEVAKAIPGCMAAIIGLREEVVYEICLKASKYGVVEPVNFNSLDQIVISGVNEALDKACILAKEKGAKIVKKLNVSAPFHSSLMLPLREKFAEKLNEFTFSNPKFPIVQNYDGEVHADPLIIKQNLIYQLNNPVLWNKSLDTMRARGAKEFIEVGPKKVLTNICISKGLSAKSSEDLIN